MKGGQRGLQAHCCCSGCQASVGGRDREIRAVLQPALCQLLMAGRRGDAVRICRTFDAESARSLQKCKCCCLFTAPAHTSCGIMVPTVDCRRQRASSSPKATASKQNWAEQAAWGELQVHSTQQQHADYAQRGCRRVQEAALRVRMVTGATARPQQQQHSLAQGQTTRHGGRGAFSLAPQKGSCPRPGGCYGGRWH